MTPQEAWEEIEEHLEWVAGFQWYTLPEETREAFNVLRALVEQPTVEDVRKEIEYQFNAFSVAYNQAKEAGLPAFMMGFSARRDTCKDLLDFIDRKERTDENQTRRKARNKRKARER